MRIDAHQHFWRYDPASHAWIDEGMSVLKHDFLPNDLADLLRSHDMDGSIAVQASQTVGETEWLLSLAKDHPTILGVVGWVDLRSPTVSGDLDRLAADSRLRGIRHAVQDEPDDDFLLRDDFQLGLTRLAPYGLVYDLLVFPRQLPAAITTVERHPEQIFVLDHLAKPNVRTGETRPWTDRIRALARCENVSCKVSGMVTEAAWHGWRHEDFTTYLDAVAEAFGPERLMFGSDWPVCLLSADYAAVFEIVNRWAESLSPAERDGIFGENAARIYGLAP